MIVPIAYRFGILLLALAAWAPCVHAVHSRAPARRPPQVRFIEFEGVHAFPPSDLKSILTTKEKRFRWFTKAPLDAEYLAEDLERIEKYYRSQGFFHARVVSHQVVALVGKEVRVEIRVEEGPPMLVSEVNFKVDGESSGTWHDELFALLPLHSGNRFTSPAYQDIEKTILRYLADWGYPKARVDLKARLDKRSNLAVISAEAKKGPVCFFGPVSLEGNEQVADRVILRELTFSAGERFSASKLQKSQRRLFNMDLFQFVDLTVENLEGEGTELPVKILLKEVKKQTIRVGAGYGTEDEFRGQVQWEMRNFLGDGRRLQLNGKASSLTQLAEGKLLQPYFLGPRSSLAVSGGMLQENQESFENRKFYLSPLYSYKWSDELGSYLGYNLEANRLLSVDVQSAALQTIDQENQEYFVSSLLEGGTWERVDDALNPRKGFRFLQSIEWSSIGLGSEVDFVKLTLEGRGYLPMKKYGVLAARLEWGGIHQLENTQDIPIIKRFFAGGSDSVRGYPYQRLGPLDAEGNPIGGMTLVEGSLEYRFPVRKSLEGVTFIDFGNVFAKSYQFLWDDMAYTAGCGVRYLTLVGPLRLDVGYQLNPPERVSFSRYQLHFSIGQAF